MPNVPFGTKGVFFGLSMVLTYFREPLDHHRKWQIIVHLLWEQEGAGSNFVQKSRHYRTSFNIRRESFLLSSPQPPTFPRTALVLNYNDVIGVICSLWQKEGWKDFSNTIGFRWAICFSGYSPWKCKTGSAANQFSYCTAKGLSSSRK